MVFGDSREMAAADRIVTFNLHHLKSAAKAFGILVVTPPEAWKEVERPYGEKVTSRFGCSRRCSMRPGAFQKAKGSRSISSSTWRSPKSCRLCARKSTFACVQAAPTFPKPCESSTAPAKGNRLFRATRSRSSARRVFTLSLGLPQAQRGARRVDEDAQPTHTHDLGDILHDRRAQGTGLLRGRRDVGDFHISEPCRRCAGHGVLQHSSARSFSDFDHRVGAGPHRDILQRPFEKLSVEGFRFIHIGRVQFHVYEGVCHNVSPPPS